MFVISHFGCPPVWDARGRRPVRPTRFCTPQQCFRPSAKHLLCRYVTPGFAGHSFRVFCQFTVVHFDSCLVSNIFSCRYSSRTLRMKLLTLILSIKIWCLTWKIWLWKDWIKWHKTTVTRWFGMQKLHCGLNGCGYVCRWRQAEIERYILRPPEVKIDWNNFVK